MPDDVHVAIGILTERETCLVGRRAPGRVYAGLWEFPGGKMGAGESASQAAVREVREETGLEAEALAELGSVTTQHEGRTFMLHIVHCRRLLGEARPVDPAVTELRWVTAAELTDLPMPPANAEIIARILPLLPRPE